MSKQRTKSSTAHVASASTVEQLKAQLRQFVQNHKHSGALFPWEVSKRLDVISTAYGRGSGEFSDFMNNLSNVKEGGVGIPSQTGYDYLRRYKTAVQLFPQPVIEAMLTNNLLPNKQKVIDATKKDPEIVNRLNGIRKMKTLEAAKWSPEIVNQIRQAASRIKAAKVNKEESLTNTICKRYRYLLEKNDPLYKVSKRAPTEEQLTNARTTAYRALTNAIARLRLGNVVTEAAIRTPLEHDQSVDREV